MCILKEINSETGEEMNIRTNNNMLNVNTAAYNNKENLLAAMSATTPITKRTTELKTSKTLFELSQSLLQRPVMSSDESFRFDL